MFGELPGCFVGVFTTTLTAFTAGAYIQHGVGNGKFAHVYLVIGYLAALSFKPLKSQV